MRSAVLVTKMALAPIFKNSNGDISAMGHLINVMLVSRVGFSGSAYRMFLLAVELHGDSIIQTIGFYCTAFE